VFNITTLGCSGGIGAMPDGHVRHTTSFLLGKRTLIDAGTGLTDLPLETLAGIDSVFLTHCHLDHVACLPMMVDSVGPMRDAPITVYGLEETLRDVQQHIFNWRIWPDFTEIPSRETPFMQFVPIRVGEHLDIDGDAQIVALPANHIVAACGYAVVHEGRSWVFSGDTGFCPPFWNSLHDLPPRISLVIETAFSERERALAEASKHLSPNMLIQCLSEADAKLPIYVTHLKPSEGDQIMADVALAAKTAGITARIDRLAQGHVFELPGATS
jgi:3',5'-cyclic-nucleotide phosphodiesterase